MKQLTGEAKGISKTIIGIITYKKSLFGSKKNLIYVSDSKLMPNGFMAYITSANPESKKEIIIANVKNIFELKEKDIVSIDPNGRINIIYDSQSKHNAVFITEKCNSNCIMCPQPPVKEEEDLFDLNIRFISLFDRNIKSIGITGGEPTLIGDKLFEIIKSINKRAPKATINILSNGIKFQDYIYTNRFHNAAGSNIIVDIPLYSDIDTIHNSIVRTNSFYKTIKGIYNLAEFNIRIGIRVVVHKMNYERLPQFSEYLYANFPFVFHIAFMQMEPIGYAKENLNELWIDPIDYQAQLEDSILILQNRNMSVSIYNTQLCLLSEKIRKYAVQSISDWKNIYLTECDNCSQKTVCPGLFESAKNIHSRAISAI